MYAFQDPKYRHAKNYVCAPQAPKFLAKINYISPENTFFIKSVTYTHGGGVPPGLIMLGPS